MLKKHDLRVITPSKIKRIPRPRDEPFDPSSPKGTTHGRVVTSTAKKSRVCDIDAELLKGKTLDQKLRSLHTAAEICLHDYYVRLPQYVDVAGSRGEKEREYLELSNVQALKRTRRVYDALARHFKTAVARKGVVSLDDAVTIQATLTRLRKIFATFAAMAGIGDGTVAAIPFNLGDS
jgi:hypothetical protein